MKMNMMPRCRLIHTKIWSSNQFALLKDREQLLYIGMVTLGDYYGRLNGDPRYLRSSIFPYREVGLTQVKKMRDRIAEVGLILSYSDKNGSYIQHPNWQKYQSLRQDRPRPSDFPAPPPDICRARDRQVTPEEKESEANEIEGNLTKLKENLDARSLMLSGMTNAGKGTQFYRKKHPPAD